MRQTAVKIIIFQFIISSAQIFGWGYDVHRRITGAAVKAVSGEFGDFLEQNIDKIAYNAANPDFWKAADPNEGPRHYIDADLYDDFPFDKIPKDIDSLYSKYGKDNISQWGIAPWIIEDYCKKLTELFQTGKWNEAIFTMSAMSHYIADIHMPLHTCENYNGQLTGNAGIHFRWESPMIEKYIESIDPPGTAVYYDDPFDMCFSIVKESFSVYHLLLRADSLARAPLTKIQADSLNTYAHLTFEDDYLSVLYAETSDIANDRLSKAANRIASFWYTCWVNAGSPKIRIGN